MAKKQKNVQLENVELKPQVIGKVYEKKTNIIGVVIVFIAFMTGVYYINDITIWINNLLHKTSSSTIIDLKEKDEKNKKEDNPINEEENTDDKNKYYISSDLSIETEHYKATNFTNENGIVKFTFTLIDTNKDNKYYLETYSENETLLERFKINTIGDNELNTKSSFDHFKITRKTVEDYPEVNIISDNVGLGTMICSKEYEEIKYSFNNGELYEINVMINNTNVLDENYHNEVSYYQQRATEINGNGITAAFSSDNSGYIYTVSAKIDVADMSKLTELYYFKFKELPKVVEYEMETSGYTCS